MTEEAVAKLATKASSKKAAAPVPVKKTPAPAKKTVATANKVPAKVQQKQSTRAAPKRTNDNSDTLSENDSSVVFVDPPPKANKTRKAPVEEIEEPEELEYTDDPEEVEGPEEPDVEEAVEGEDEDIEMEDESNVPSARAASAVSEETMQ